MLSSLLSIFRRRFSQHLFHIAREKRHGAEAHRVGDFRFQIVCHSSGAKIQKFRN